MQYAFPCVLVLDGMKTSRLGSSLALLAGILAICAFGQTASNDTVETNDYSDFHLSLKRNECWGSCPAYTVTASSAAIRFTGRAYTRVEETVEVPIDPAQLRMLAEALENIRFFTFDRPRPNGCWTDAATFTLIVRWGGRERQVGGYTGCAEDPIVLLAVRLDEILQTSRWIK